MSLRCAVVVLLTWMLDREGETMFVHFAARWLCVECRSAMSGDVISDLSSGTMSLD